MKTNILLVIIALCSVGALVFRYREWRGDQWVVWWKYGGPEFAPGVVEGMAIHFPPAVFEHRSDGIYVQRKFLNN